jgi:hypothetical protein
VGSCKGVIDVEIEEWRELSDEMGLQEFLGYVVDIFFGAES